MKTDCFLETLFRPSGCAERGRQTGILLLICATVTFNSHGSNAMTGFFLSRDIQGAFSSSGELSLVGTSGFLNLFELILLTPTNGIRKPPADESVLQCRVWFQNEAVTSPKVTPDQLFLFSECLLPMG